MRKKVLGKEQQLRIGGMINFSDAELQVNAMLMQLKAKELAIARGNITTFPPGVHFFSAKTLIDDSEVFKIIKTMPKGKLVIYTRR